VFATQVQAAEERHWRRHWRRHRHRHRHRHQLLRGSNHHQRGVEVKEVAGVGTWLAVWVARRHASHLGQDQQSPAPRR